MQSSLQFEICAGARNVTKWYNQNLVSYDNMFANEFTKNMGLSSRGRFQYVDHTSPQSGQQQL